MQKTFSLLKKLKNTASAQLCSAVSFKNSFPGQSVYKNKLFLGMVH